MGYSTQNIFSILDGRLLNQNRQHYVIEHLLFDSRKVLFPKSSLFFAIKGSRNNGHHYIEPLYQSGVRNFIVSQFIKLTDYPEANFFLVQDVLRTLQQLATYHRNQFDLKVIGITGSNGKTIIKEWLFQLLQEDFNIVRNPKSYNSQIGVPLSVWQINKEHNLGIFEAGISQTNEMKHLAPIIQPQIGLFTNIGEAHSEGFASNKEKILEKLDLFQETKTLIYCADHKALDHIILKKNNWNVFRWSASKKVEFRITKVSNTTLSSTIIEGIINEKPLALSIPFTDQASIENALHCAAIMLQMGYPHQIIEARIKRLTPVAMRLELKKGIRNCTLVNDSYNNDLNALSIALNFLEQQGNQSKRTVILSDILQSGDTASTLYKKVADLIIEKKVNRFFGIGSAIPIIRQFLPDDIYAVFYAGTNDFLDSFQSHHFQEELILIKGARPFTFEKIVDRLSQKIHKTVLEINLNALQNNLNVYTSRLNKSTKIMVMVKASAYGSGSVEVAKLLEFHQVDYLAVAYADEGIRLRESGIQLPILVLNPDISSFDVFYRYQLEPEIYNLDLLHELLHYFDLKNKRFPIHIKLDTGMHRLGFTEADLDALIAVLKDQKKLEVKSVFSHLAGSESSLHDDFSRRQMAIFDRCYTKIVNTLNNRPIRHILNSGGIIRFPQYQLDMVRLGIGLYGIDASDKIQNQLSPVLTLKARISQIKTIKAGETIGYDRKGKAHQPMTIAIISIGYADGFLRGAGNGRYPVLIHHKRTPVIGNICMDMCMVDITSVPEAQTGDEVIIFGKEPKVQELAKVLSTIPYEIFTGISDRVKRVYYQD